MNKLELIEMLKNRSSLTLDEATKVVNLFFSEIALALQNGERVELRGLWSFHLKKYKSYTGRNPKTGKIVQVASKRLPFFKCGKELKDRVNFPPN
ncbi:HU family DNA-binding protein [Desulfobacula phenolica]|uniref:Integration host factor subunit beta n=1 Tax=Desulfobacula phenolica TaxID=90732 RepID=A0A1H2DSX5_9BACT|nr:HU family DNA-binding protein [Desulfobacula phenolica]SDT85999.1 integration host factor subunit beta [Desulfobacula phenolica]